MNHHSNCSSEKAAASAELNNDRYDEEEEDDKSLNRFPDEILLLIFNKLLDLKCLCVCSLVSKRFSSIILHVHSVSFTVPRLKQPNSTADHDIENPPNPDFIDNLPKKVFRFVAKPLQFLRRIVAPNRPLPPMISSFYGHSFRSAVYFMSKFKEIRSLRMELPSSCHGGNIGNDDSSLFKWTAKFGSRIESFVFLSPTFLRQFHEEGGEEEEEGEGSRLVNDLKKQRVHLAFQCLKDVIVRHRMLLFFVKEHPMLQSIAITDSDKQGRLLLRGEKLVELRDWIDSASETVTPQLKRIEVPVAANQWYVPVLQLPISRYVMKGATLVLMEMVERRGSYGGGDDLGVIGDAFEDGEEAFSEAVVEMMVKHKSRMKTLL